MNYLINCINSSRNRNPNIKGFLSILMTFVSSAKIMNSLSNSFQVMDILCKNLSTKKMILKVCIFDP